MRLIHVSLCSIQLPIWEIRAKSYEMRALRAEGAKCHIDVGREESKRKIQAGDENGRGRGDRRQGEQGTGDTGRSALGLSPVSRLLSPVSRLLPP